MGISGILQLLAVVGFVLGIIGVVLTVMAVTQGRSWRNSVTIAGIGFIVGILFSILGSGILEVGVTETAVVYNTLSGSLDAPQGPGVHIILPWYQITRYQTNQQEYTMSGAANEGARSGNDQVSARSVDGQEVFMDVTILFRVPPENVNRIHQDWNGSSYQEVFIRPTVRSVVRDVVSSYQAEEIYGLKRDDLQAQIEAELAAKMEDRGFELSNVLLRNISFSAEFTQAIEDKQIEEQKLQQAQTAAQRREAEAKGNANAAIETARGDAEARLVQARAEAEGLRLISDQLAANPNLLQYIYIQSLAPDIKLALIPSNTPFLFDSSTFTNLAPGFSAPAVPELVPTTTPEAP